MEILSALATVVAALGFVFGVSAWGREFRGKRRIELAENVLALFYEAQEVIREMRNPASFGGEGSSRPRVEDESDEERKIRDSAYVPFERFKRYESLFSRLRSTKFSFMAMFGVEESLAFNDLTVVVNQVLHAARELGTRFWLDQGRRQMSQLQLDVHHNLLDRYQAMFWEGTPEEDELAQKVQAAVSRIERVAKNEAEASRWWGDKLLGLVRRKDATGPVPQP